MKEMKPIKSEKYGFASVWSHRHTAYVAGQGTFGLSEGLITKRGVAVRFTSFVVGKKFEPDKREYKEHTEWCLFFKDGSCGACIKRCPAGAITNDGHDKGKCNEYLIKMSEKHHKNPLFDPNVEVGCGLCQSAVPCAGRAPL
jgi:epoxyqueuosine reductase QueG